MDVRIRVPPRDRMKPVRCRKTSTQRDIGSLARSSYPEERGLARVVCRHGMNHIRPKFTPAERHAVPCA
jgi:hypothetical protein